MKLIAALRKDLQLLFSDKIGLFLLFALPLVLVVVVTSVQSTAFDIVNENRITLLIVNHDEGNLGEELTELLSSSNMFSIESDPSVKLENLKQNVLERDKFSALYIPKSFSSSLNNKTTAIVSSMMIEFGLLDSMKIGEEQEAESLYFVYDPVLQKNFSSSILNSFYSYLNVLENKLMIQNLYLEMGYDEVPRDFSEQLLNNKVTIQSETASDDQVALAPNVTQHNVPAWTIFAMFFMVVSLGGNMVNERTSGAFVRLKTMPTPFPLVLLSKMLVFMFVAIIQVVLIFSMGIHIFPSLGLPSLVMPNDLLPLAVLVLISAYAAVSYALLIGSIAKTQVQANGFGAISIIIFAALGGIWVPSFVMPENLQLISHFSPLKWCLDGFYTLFLQGGGWAELMEALFPLIIFIISAQLISFVMLRIEKII